MPTATKLSSWAPSCRETFLEPLEDRIAPAIINAGPASSGGIDYHDTPFYSTDSDPSIPNHSDSPSISALFGDSEEHYYITLKAGDTLKIYNSAGGAGYENFIQVTGGEVVAFFHDVAHGADPANGMVDADELTGLTLGAKANVKVYGSVNGDIVANYQTSTKTVDATSLISNTQTISGLFVSGSVSGRIIAGGNIANVTVVGNVEQINTGSAADGYEYDFGGGAPSLAGVATLNPFVLATKQAGSSISNITVGSLNDASQLGGDGKIVASDGGVSGAGGSLANITINADASGLTLQAGNGGAGSATSLNGGVGGKISTVYMKGVADTTAGDAVKILAGNGGDAGSSSPTVFGSGGAGGILQNIYVGYEVLNKKIVRSDVLIQDIVSVEAGDGGSGKVGGAGGSTNGVKLATATPFVSAASAELSISGGAGGDAADVAKSKAGAGGGVLNTEIRDYYLDDGINSNPRLNVAAGDGGAGGLQGVGGAGGAVTTAKVLGYRLFLSAGDGLSGITGGRGGSVSGIVAETFDNVVAEEILFTAGIGGNATTGVAGAGGSLTSLTLASVDVGAGDFQFLAGNGGTSTGSKGGAGGAIGTVQLNDGDSANSGEITFAAGNGGNGASLGGTGGTLTTITLVGTGADVFFTAGTGGTASNAKAAGGAGGSINRVTAVGVHDTDKDPLEPLFRLNEVTVAAGNGGASGPSGKGGLGGYVLNSNFTGELDVSITSGSGGAAGNLGVSGNGGYIKGSSGTSFSASLETTAGSGGNSGAAARGGVGGAITAFTAYANTDLTVQAGNGTGGSAGGGLNTITFGGADFTTSPTGTVLIAAGNGSGLGVYAGAGGSIVKINGFASSSTVLTTTIKAGDGGSGSKGGAAGGSITTATIRGGATGDDALITVWAGEGGDAPTAGKGGSGGSITSLNVAGNVLIANLLAGDGGDSFASTGGVGGSISKVYSQGDIGYRSGKTFGFDPDGTINPANPTTWYSHMGGIFAGVGGTGVAATAKSGSVLTVTANAIASIVAGKNLDSPALVNVVNQIVLNGNTASSGLGTVSNNWSIATIVGGIAGSPAAAGADDFKVDVAGFPTAWLPADSWVLGSTKPLDGLVAALTLGSNNRNFSPSAFLSIDTSGATLFAGTRVPV